MKKDQFIILCDALETNIITTEQFYVLCDYNTDDIVKIVNTMQMVTTNKEIFFNKLCKSTNISVINKILHNYPIYCRDLKRQQFLFENENNFKQSINVVAQIFSYEELWKDKEFVNLFLEKVYEHPNLPLKIIDNIACFYKNIDNIEKEQVISSDEFISFLKKAIEIDKNNYCNIGSFLEYINIKALRDEPIWFDYLMKFYNSEDSWYPKEYACYLKDFEEYGYLNKITSKLLEIEESKEKDKVTIFNTFFENIASIGNRSEIILDKSKAKNEPLFDLLIDYAPNTDSPHFVLLINLVEMALKNNTSMETIKYRFDILKKCCYPNVESLLLYMYFEKEYDFLDKDSLEKVIYMKWDEAKDFLVERAIKTNQTSYIEKEKKYYGEYFDQSFMAYLSSGLSKKELLELKNKIIKCQSKFINGHFVIDSTDIINLNSQAKFKDDTDNEEKDYDTCGYLEALKKITNKILNKKLS